MPARWLKEPVRLSSQGFHLVIPDLGIHTTLLPPETSCLNTNSLKETSHCHFSSGSLLLAPLLSFLHPFSTPSASPSTYFLLVLFYVVFLPLPHPRDGRGRKTFLCLFSASLIVCAFLIVSEQMLSAVVVVAMAVWAIYRELFD